MHGLEKLIKSACDCLLSVFTSFGSANSRFKCIYFFKSTPDSCFVLLGTHQWCPVLRDKFFPERTESTDRPAQRRPGPCLADRAWRQAGARADRTTRRLGGRKASESAATGLPGSATAVLARSEWQGGPGRQRAGEQRAESKVRRGGC